MPTSLQRNEARESGHHALNVLFVDEIIEHRWQTTFFLDDFEGEMFASDGVSCEINVSACASSKKLEEDNVVQCHGASPGGFVGIMAGRY